MPRSGLNLGSSRLGLHPKRWVSGGGTAPGGTLCSLGADSTPEKPGPSRSVFSSVLLCAQHFLRHRPSGLLLRRRAVAWAVSGPPSPQRLTTAPGSRTHCLHPSPLCHSPERTPGPREGKHSGEATQHFLPGTEMAFSVRTRLVQELGPGEGARRVGEEGRSLRGATGQGGTAGG